MTASSIRTFPVFDLVVVATTLEQHSTTYLIGGESSETEHADLGGDM